MDKRREALLDWLTKEQKYTLTQLTPLAGDASLRRYFRVILTDGSSHVAMDAPVAHENSHAFVAIAQLFARAGVTVPQILAQDLAQGFLLVSDLGDKLYLQALREQEPGPLYNQALMTLMNIQMCSESQDYALPYFDEALFQRELMLFYDWFLIQHLQLTLTTAQQHMLQSSFAWLIQTVLLQPRVCVHRDYHSRNLLLLPENKVGVIDFQDALWGPVAYDVVSLLKDCYIDWPQVSVEQWVREYHQQARSVNILPQVSFDQFLDWFTVLGIQRHLKAIGIFARLDIHYHKPAYLQDIPRTLRYITEALPQCPALSAFHTFLEHEVWPRLMLREKAALI